MTLEERKKRKEKLSGGRIFNVEFPQLVTLLLAAPRSYFFRASLGAVSHSVLAVLWSAVFDNVVAF